jgi:hypothetical protein
MNEHWKNWIGWSNVRQQMWDECPRAFFNRYIGRWESTEKGRTLSKLSNLRPLRAQGSIYVMDVLGTQLHHAMLGRGTDEAQAREMLDGRFDYLARHRYKLTEHVNGGAVGDKAIEAQRKRAHRMLGNFYKKLWPAMSGAVPLEHGRILSYDVNGHRVWLNVDAAFRDGKGVVVTQLVSNGNGRWSEGNGKLGFSPEACTRALWAMKLYRLPQERVKVERLDLERPGMSRFASVEPLDIKRFKEHVERMCGEWENIRSEDDAPAAPEESKCQACAFATACAAGGEFVGKSG